MKMLVIRDKLIALICYDLIAVFFTAAYWFGVQKMFESFAYLHFYGGPIFWGSTVTSFYPRSIVLSFLLGMVLAFILSLFGYYNFKKLHELEKA